MARHLIFGIPATLVMFLTLFLVLRRTQHLYAEIDLRTSAEIPFDNRKSSMLLDN